MSKHPITHTALALLLAAAFVLPASADEGVEGSGDSVHRRLIAQKAGAIVTLRYTLSVHFNFRGQSGNREFNRTASGVLVDPKGLVMVSSSNFDSPFANFSGAESSARPVNMRIVFPGEESEFPAILGATDTRLNLSFVLAKDLEGKEVTTVDLARETKPTVGSRLWGVTRLGHGFDHAPVCDAVDVLGRITKPRKMWFVPDAGRFLAEPLYDEAGAVAGVVVQQEGVGGSGGSGTFLLPLGIAKATIERALTQSEEALEEALEREAEEEATAAAEGDAGSEDGDSGNGDSGDGDSGDDDSGDDDSGNGDS